MRTIVEYLDDVPIVSFAKGDAILTQGEISDKLYILFDGSIEVVSDSVQVAIHSNKGAVFGEMSILLDTHHTATVRCLQPSKFYVIDDPKLFIEQHTEVIWYISQILASRLFTLTEYIVNVSRQNIEGDSLGIVNDVLETLLDPKQKIGLQGEDRE